MEPYYRNDRSIIVRIRGVDHHFHGYLSGRHDLRNAVTGMPFVTKGPDGVTGLLTDAGFDDLLERGELTVVSARSPDRVRILNDAAELTMAEAREIDPEVDKMLAQIELLDAAGVKNGSKAIETFLDRDGGWTDRHRAAWGDHDLPGTIKSWRSKRGVPGCRHPRQMIRLNGKLARSRWTDVEEEILWKHALTHKTVNGGTSTAWSLYCDEIGLVNAGRHPVHPAPAKPYKAVSERTFYRRVRQLLDADTEQTKKGKAALEQDWRGAGRPLTADHVMQRVIVDHTEMDVFVVDDTREMVLGRPWLTLAIDVRTRAIVAHVITFVPPSIWTVGEILRRMAMPKRPPAELLKRHPILRRLRGRPDQIIVDNATEFRSLFFEAAARGLGFSIRYCPVKKPRYRAICERAIGTANAAICQEMSGRVLPIAEARHLDYDGEGQAVVIMDELEAVANWWVAEYNTEPHSGIRDEAPADVFQREAARHGIMNFRDLDRFRLETMDIVPEAEVDAGGITRWGLRWQHAARVPELLNDLVKAEPGRRRRQDAAAKVMFRFDPMDLSRIWVWNRIGQEYVELECADQEYARGMPLAFHLDLARRAAERKLRFNTSADRIAVRSRRIAAIRSIDPKAKARSRAEVARLKEIPRLRAIVGNIIDLDVHSSHPGDLEGFITADPASYTALDMEILGKRKGIEDGGTPPDPTVDAEPDAAAGASRTRRGRLTRGGLR
ncbi:DDE-type integrase/transposase/recombinase [Sphingomonas sanguinis]|uniref:Mu transposase C-terminal domain-containing protein n=1 Tax=Sphingomonas sanguinis TaxID=33051 RepID=UPI001C58711D|nr:Mu transposase C-terminal domain-containing protein [Sphingomonas sanguinis]QXT34808.1 DDE-type integrase/transposase/recombinase [Sphingomonas sanguinis]